MQDCCGSLWPMAGNWLCRSNGFPVCVMLHPNKGHTGDLSDADKEYTGQTSMRTSQWQVYCAFINAAESVYPRGRIWRNNSSALGCVFNTSAAVSHARRSCVIP